MITYAAAPMHRAITHIQKGDRVYVQSLCTRAVVLAITHDLVVGDDNAPSALVQVGEKRAVVSTYDLFRLGSG